MVGIGQVATRRGEHERGAFGKDRRRAQEREERQEDQGARPSPGSSHAAHGPKLSPDPAPVKVPNRPLSAAPAPRKRS